MSLCVFMSLWVFMSVCVRACGCCSARAEGAAHGDDPHLAAQEVPAVPQHVRGPHLRVRLLAPAAVQGHHQHVSAVV